MKKMHLLYFSTVNWKWIKQRPHFLAEHLSSNGINVDYLSLTPLFKQKIHRKRIDECLNIIDTYVIPLASKIRLIELINVLYIKMKLRNKVYDKIILTHPHQYQYLTRNMKRNTEIIYEAMDNMPYFYEDDKREEVKVQEKSLCEKASKIIVSASYLKDRIEQDYNIIKDKIHVIYNAVDKEMIYKSLYKVELKSPNLVYIGTISEWLDLHILSSFAKKNPNYHIYLIGPIEEKLKKEIMMQSSNIIVTGSIPHEKVKDYVYSGEIMLIPFEVNELIRGVDPVKLYEYLAMNKPIVSSYWGELSRYKDNKLIKFYSCDQEFEKSVYSIHVDSKSGTVINKSFVEENDWESRVKQYIEVLNKE